MEYNLGVLDDAVEVMNSASTCQNPCKIHTVVNHQGFQQHHFLAGV